MDRQSKILLPLFVDLDGTLLNTDTFFEAFLLLLREAPLKALKCIFWVFLGKAKLKTKVSNEVALNVAILPYNSHFVSFLESQHQLGRKLYLATGSPAKIAHQVAEHLKIFSGVLATEETNLVSNEKLKAIRQVCGGGEFSYAGNSRQDLKIWKEAAEAILVNTSARLTMKAERIASVTMCFPRARIGIKVFARALRIHQWVKNVLIFVPLVSAHKVFDLQILTNTFLGFLSFSLCASSVYVLNDLLDVTDDRKHRTKRFRPFASGQLPLWSGLILNPILLIAGLSLAIQLSSEFALILALYIVATTLYTFFIKSFVLWDIILLAGLYTLRIFAGGVLAAPVSPWLLAFSAFFFLSLALAKRYTELLYIKNGKTEVTNGRGYQADDLEFISSLGVSASYTALLIFVLYINSADVTKLYLHPMRLWGLVPLLFYWVSRIWLFTHRGKMADDPVIYALRDKTSYFIFVFGAVTMWLAL